MSLRNGLWPTSGGRLGFIQVMGSVLQGKAVGTPAENSGRHSGLTSSSSIPAQDSEPRRGGLMGWGEGLLPVSSWEGRGHHRDTLTTHSWGELSPLEVLVCWEGAKGYCSARTPQRSTSAHQLKRRVCFLNETEGEIVP